LSNCSEKGVGHMIVIRFLQHLRNDKIPSAKIVTAPLSDIKVMTATVEMMAFCTKKLFK